jgi:valyl-tRNA synthetase
VRVVHPHLEGNREPLKMESLQLADRWILARLDETIRTVTESLEPPTLRFSDAAQALYRFTWDDFCSSYLEIRKKVITSDATTPEALAAKKQAVSVFATVLEKLIGLLHPFMPFITEEIRQAIGSPDLLITSKWPEPVSAGDADAKATMDVLLKIVESTRSIRGDYGITPAQATDIRISCDSEELSKRLQPHAYVISSLERAGSVSIETSAAKPAFSASGLFPGGRIFIPLQGILDPAQEKVRLTKDLAKAESMVAAQEKKLANEAFVKSAPAEVVEGERLKLQSQVDKIGKLKAALADLG